ncbi:MAG: 2-hydroxyacid dehydrogenase [Proteobacteria bacterium]|jgi:lactate dehydrogenase-like 2-hydroxyacid dehydrogenase|nr:2-hydroxyacid dehydrogenase [Pseudomonadota bacterium]
MDDLLVIGKISEEAEIRLKAQFILHKSTEIADFDAFIKEFGHRIKAISTNGFVGAKKELILKLKNLKIISSNGVGYDAIDTEACVSREIIVTHTPDVLNAEVANTTVMMFLNSFREFTLNEEHVRSRRWATEGMAPFSRSPDNRVVGIIGMGRIGMEIAKRLSIFNPSILYHSRTPKEVPYKYYADLKDMAKDSEVLICITPGGKATSKIVNIDIINALGPEGTLINVARGSVVDEDALVLALEEGRLGYAALDVFEKEPKVPEKLLKMPNVVLLPHVGSATFETRKAMSNLTVDNLLNFKENGTPLTPVPECLHLVQSTPENSK